MSPSLAQVMTKAALKSDENNSALFRLQEHHVQHVCKAERLEPSGTFISINNFLLPADDLWALTTGWFGLTVRRTVSETCRVCDAVMDTL